MKFIPTDLPDVMRVIPRVFGDRRGYFKEIYRQKLFREMGIAVDFVQDNVSRSRRGILRGLHYQLQHPQAKLVTVAFGRVLDVVVDLRRSSTTFGRYVAVELSEDNHELLYIPVGFAHGFQVLSDEAVFQYKCSDYYFPGGERGIRWNDPGLALPWRDVESTVVSERDAAWPRLEEVPEPDLYP